MSDVQLTTLNNGLRVVTDNVPSVESVAIGVWADVGSRNEEAAVNGIAHMVEHMMFKGTQSRNAQDIVEQIENVGGHMNAYTSREITSYHIHLLSDDLSLAVEVLGDMYSRSTLPEDELIKERQVILQEIGMCKDTPDDLIFDHYYEAAYDGQAVGRSILGPSEIVANMPREALAQHIKQFYTADNSVIVAAGNVDHDALVALVEAHFDLASADIKAAEAARYTGGEKRDSKDDLEQSHIILGFDAPSRHADNHYDVRVLATLLGGGMSSRLFQEVREKRGLVYSVFAFYQAMQDTGQLGIYAGTGPEQVAELMPVLCEEALKVQNNVSEAEITRTRAQLKSSLLMGRESMMNRADRMAKSVLYKGEMFDPAVTAAQIDAVSVQSVMGAARDIFASDPTLAAIGPLSQLEDFDAIKARLG